MNIKKYDKLVRDLIPEVIEKTGKACTVSVLSNDEYLTRLNDKLLEETKEYLESGEAEELADILEVINAIIESKGLTNAEVEAIRLKKKEERGGFSKRLLLTEVRG